MILLQARDQARRRRRIEVYADTRRRLRAASAEFVPGRRVILFGSLTKPGIFNDRSDVDVALIDAPPEVDSLRFTSELME